MFNIIVGLIVVCGIVANLIINRIFKDTLQNVIIKRILYNLHNTFSCWKIYKIFIK